MKQPYLLPLLLTTQTAAGFQAQPVNSNRIRNLAAQHGTSSRGVGLDPSSLDEKPASPSDNNMNSNDPVIQPQQEQQQPDLVMFMDEADEQELIQNLVEDILPFASASAAEEFIDRISLPFLWW